MGALSCHDAGFNCITIIQEKTEDEIMEGYRACDERTYIKAGSMSPESREN